MSSSGASMPRVTEQEWTGTPSKQSSSTFLSAAMMTPLAPATSAAVMTFLEPPWPCVSSLMRTPISAAFFSRASAAMKVWAMPVGHAVIASTS